MFDIQLKVFVASASFYKNQDLMFELANLGCVLVPPDLDLQFMSDAEKSIFFPRRELTEEELVKLARGCEIILLGRTPLSERSIKALQPSLKLISIYGVGHDQVDVHAAIKLGIPVKWTSGINRREVAELVVGTMINHYRNLGLSHSLMRQGQWLKNGGSSLDGKKIGIVGLGAVGTALVDYLSPWEVEIFYNDILDRSEVAGRFKYLSFDELIATCDVISFHVPLDKSTRLMLDKERVEKLRKDCLVINMSRGPVVDFRALADAVRNGKIGGFAVDVYDTEPFDGSTFDHPNIYMTPHIGGNSIQAVQKMGSAVISQIKSFLGSL